ncbi:MAG: transposase [Planctomycetes bacterium]|nr:transposase [Planctomycetota bacterium]
MARPLRIEFPGALYHVTSRGNEKRPIVIDDDDRRLFLGILSRAIERSAWLCHAYCLMNNHYHLLVETPQPTLSAGMHYLNGVYGQKFNLRHDRTGHLFQGRFKSILIEKEPHLLEVMRYVVLNPVRARIVAQPEHWLWSSYRATAGLTRSEDFLSTHWVLSKFAGRRTAARQAYRRYVAEGAGLVSPWDKTHADRFLGSKAFIAKCLGRIDSTEALQRAPEPSHPAIRPSLTELFQDIADRRDKRGTAAAIRCAFEIHGYLQRDIAHHLGVHCSTVSRALGRPGV